MGIVSIPKRKTTETEEAGATESRDWVNIAAGGSLMAGGLLLLTGQRDNLHQALTGTGK